jgi:hypothetical protein
MARNLPSMAAAPLFETKCRRETPLNALGRGRRARIQSWEKPIIVPTAGSSRSGGRDGHQRFAEGRQNSEYGT